MSDQDSEKIPEKIPEKIKDPWVTFVDSPSSTLELTNLARALSEEDDRYLTELDALNPTQAQETAERLAQEISEDQELAKELAGPIEPTESDLFSKNLDREEIESGIEALLFVSDKPLSSAKLHQLLGPELDQDLFLSALDSLRERYQAIHHGVELVEVGGGLQFRTKPGRASVVKRLAKLQTQRLSTGAMESLAIIAYRQPVMKEEIDKIRGVDSSYFVRGLMEKNLIQISGRSELPGRPILYTTTQAFLELFGLSDLSSLPPLRELEQMIPASEAMKEDEDPRIKNLRTLLGQMKQDQSSALQYNPREDEQLLRQIREKIGSISTSTPYIEEQKNLEKQAALATEILTQGA